MSATRLPSPAALVATSMAAAASALADNADAALHNRWRGLRDDGSLAAVAAVVACVDFARDVGLLNEERQELWLGRLTRCPGHDDEGGRDWCAYCGQMPQSGGERG